MKIALFYITMMLLFVGCEINIFEPRLQDDNPRKHIKKIPFDTILVECPIKHRCIGCDSLNMTWQKIYIDTLK